jgi:hypothetical protein
VNNILHYLDTSNNIKYGVLADKIREINGRIRDELEDLKFFSIEKEKNKYFYDMKKSFGEKIYRKFVRARFEIDEAGKCLALGRPTACVFHLMRTTEIAINATRLCLNIPDPLKPAERNWGYILKKFDDEIKERDAGTSKSWKNKKDKELFREFHGSLDVVRNLWRNNTMHVEIKYTDDEAEHILYAVRALMTKIASRLDHYGRPFA